MKLLLSLSKGGREEFGVTDTYHVHGHVIFCVVKWTQKI